MAAIVPDAELAEAVCAALRAQVRQLGLSLGDEPCWHAAQLREQRDPCSGEIGVSAVWRGGARFGMACFFADGHVFAEYQVLQPHPQDPACYVEAVQVWGNGSRLRGDVVLVARPG